MSRKRLQAVRLLLAANMMCLLCGAGWGDRDKLWEFDIPRQNVSTALSTLAQQTGTQLLFPYDQVSSQEANPLAGRYTLDEALEIMLRGTGLAGGVTGSGVITISLETWAKSQEQGDDMGREKKKGLLAGVTAAVLSVFSSQNAAGQQTESGDHTAVLEEIIVTAQKREQRLQDVPISISVLPGAQLDRSVGRGLNDELISVPGVAVSELAQTGGSQITVRGIGAPFSIFFGSSPVGFYVDSVPFGFVKTAVTPNVSPYDLERVEVLRGPQGTLYGASAQNGVVRVLTKDADLSRLEFKMRTDISNTQYGDMNYGGDAAFNLPIVQDKLALRAVVGYHEHSGWIDSAFEDEYNSGDILNARLKLNARPTENLSLGLSAWMSRSSFGGPNAGLDDRTTRASVFEPIDTDYESFSLTIGYDFAPFSLSSATSFIDYRIDSRLDAPAPTPPFPQPFDGLNVLTTDIDTQLIAEEITLTSTHEGPWRWSLGAMYRKATETGFQARRNPITGGFAGVYLAPTIADDTSESYAVFGELTRLFWDGRLELTGGVRYFEDEVTLEEKSRLSFAGGVPPTGLVNSTQTFDATSPRLALSWHATDQVTAYVSYSEGFRSGFTQASAALVADPNFAPAEPDNLINYEIGAKGELLDGRLTFDAAAYYMKWEDVQTPLILETFGTFLAATVNGESASGSGFDLGLTARPTDSLSVNLSYSVNDLTQDADVFSNVGQVAGKGHRLPLSPKYTIGGSADYVFPLGASGFAGRMSFSGTYTSGRFPFGFFFTPDPVPSSPSFLANAAFSIESPRDWTITLYVDNAANEQDAVVPNLSVIDWTPRIRPRTIGLQADYHFGRE